MNKLCIEKKRGEVLSILSSSFSGLLVALAFPKFNLWWMAWFGLVPFFYNLYKAKSVKEALPNGFAYGLVFFAVDLFWVTSLYRFVGGWVYVGWMAFILFQTLFVLLFSFIVVIQPQKMRWIGMPLAWVFVEWARSLGAFGFTGGVLGYTQYQLLPLIQIAAYTKVYGVSFLLVFMNSAIAGLIVRKKNWLFVFAAVALVLISWMYGSLQLNDNLQWQEGIKIAIVQPNIDQMDKMNPGKNLEIYGIHEQLTRQAMSYKPEIDKPEIIIWPETAIFSYLTRDPILFPRIKKLANETGAWLVVGTPYYGADRKSYNSIVSISPSGEVVSRYDKRRLVPFGEYLPFRPLLYPFLKGTGYYENNFSFGREGNVLSAGKYKIVTAICFESTFTELERTEEAKKSDFILTVTNDGWFGDSSAPYFHLVAGVFRAVENHKCFVQAGNTGFSAVISPVGKILAETKLGRREILTFDLR